MIRSLSLRLCALMTVLALGCDPGTSTTPSKTELPAPPPKGCESGELWSGTACLAKPAIKVNTVGYLVGRVKRATAPAVDGTTKYSIVDAVTDEVVYPGNLLAPTQNTDTGDVTTVIDFTAFEMPGSYVIKIDGLAPSPVFHIGPDSLNEALRVTMLGLYGQRCGVAVRFEHQGNTYSHEACHKDDALLDGTQVDGTGGWHDAGDYGKYTVNAAFSLAFILKAWEDFGSGLGTLEHIPNRTGELPAWLNEAKFQLDQILKMQHADGSAAHMLGPWAKPGPAAFPGMIPPEQDFTQRAFSGIGTAATADLAAIAAIAARVFRPFDPQYADACLTAAKLAEAYLEQHTASELPDFSNFTHQAYRTQDTDDRFWAQVELWRTTGDPALLAAVESTLRTSIPINFDWSNVDNLGMFSYVQAESEARDPAKFAEAKRIIVASADALSNGAGAHAYGRGVGAMYYWGSNGVVARSAMNLLVAYGISADETKSRYLDAAVQQIDHLLGRNPFGRSFVTGLGYLPAMHPHHRQSEGDMVFLPWPGLLVGGPNSGKDDDPVKALRATGLAPGLVWFDDAGSYGTNEVAINWNAALAYALAGFYR
ncbi:MAG TPA: glycoside hydrolase family 9 protein [Polyangiaceae bacterium]